ncbi:MAG TPA: hypothetical protein VFQ96_02005 [Microbacteriaceae bacterium]|nr:hypothetical protein [Microbacteriaceae bacterium]
MIGWFTIVVVTIATLSGVLCVVLGLIGKAPNDLSMGGTALVALLMFAQLVITIVAPFAGNHPTGSLFEFYLYLVSAVLLPFAGGLWALMDRTRWSTVVLGAICLAIAVMMVRMSIIWNVQGA